MIIENTEPKLPVFGRMKSEFRKRNQQRSALGEQLDNNNNNDEDDSRRSFSQHQPKLINSACDADPTQEIINEYDDLDKNLQE